MKLKYLSYFLVLPFILSCSVKEDRIKCPAWLDVIFSKLDKDTVYVNISNPNLSKEKIISDTINIKDIQHKVYTVNKPFVDLVVLDKNIQTEIKDFQYLVKEDGCKEFYAYTHKNIQLFDGVVRDSVKLTKQYCAIRVNFKSVSFIDNKYSFKVFSNTKGVNTLNLQPIKGACVIIPKIKDNSISFNLPRQADNDYKLVIYYNNNPVKDLKMGEYMSNSGYQWNKSSLDDFEFITELEVVSVSVKIGDWDKGEFITL